MKRSTTLPLLRSFGIFAVLGIGSLFAGKTLELWWMNPGTAATPRQSIDTFSRSAPGKAIPTNQFANSLSSEAAEKTEKTDERAQPPQTREKREIKPRNPFGALGNWEGQNPTTNTSLVKTTLQKEEPPALIQPIQEEKGPQGFTLDKGWQKEYQSRLAKSNPQVTEMTKPHTIQPVHNSENTIASSDVIFSQLNTP
ncbi:MAG: hypothetical protein MPJ24_10200, partial [Pirellulaceae bacterium]|nr:hypothetical protein [Pirellulaceae bacterium]